MFNTSLRYNFNSGIAVTPNQQTPLRQVGFGGHFKDAPPPFITETKEENKIERVNKPKVKKNKKKKQKTEGKVKQKK
mgnify:CR=1 FL=1|tara:strand:- start:321 stop:551 length:231 start_codon:yes stop_codon:yes gene_type:complete